jgi:hypothetical protein
MRFSNPLDLLALFNCFAASDPVGRSRCVGQFPKRWCVALLRPQREKSFLIHWFLPHSDAGLLRQRRATTHWRFADEFQRRFPETRVEIDRIVPKERAAWHLTAQSS